MQGDGPGTLTSMHLPNPSKEVIRYIAKPAETRKGAVANVLELILDYIIEFLDYQTFIHCHKVLSKTVKTAGIGAYADRYAVQLPWRRALKEAATHAQQTISSEPWTEQDPRCCSECCPYSRKTGLWTKRGPEGWDIFGDNKLGHLGMRPCIHFVHLKRTVGGVCKKWHVVCSERCFIRVKMALETIKLHTKQDYGIVIGVGPTEWW